MKRILMAALTLLFALSLFVPAPNKSVAAARAQSGTASAEKKKRGPVFRATKDQVKQAQAILKQRAFYSGEATGKLDPDTRAGLKKYQLAENIKVTGTLNRATLEQMGIPLTDRQKTM